MWTPRYVHIYSCTPFVYKMLKTFRNVKNKAKAYSFSLSVKRLRSHSVGKSAFAVL